MPIAELRAHVAHAYAEFCNECGYCWLEGEANSGEYGGGGYDYFEYAPEPAYNPFRGTYNVNRYPGFADADDAALFYAYRCDVLIGMSVNTPNMCSIITSIS